MPGISPRASNARKPDVFPEATLKRIQALEAAAETEMVGITTSDGLVPGVFPLKSTGLSTKSIVEATHAYLDSLSDKQRENGSFPMESPTWRLWSNGAIYLTRHGNCLEDLDDNQKELALGIIKETLSGKGYAVARDSMRLNKYVGVLTGHESDFDEWLYWMSIYGDPVEGGAWGWQLDGHHFNLSVAIIGDQITMTPHFMGAEPKWVDFGPDAGIRMFRWEEDDGLRFMQALDKNQQAAATILEEMPEDLFTGRGRDNFELNYEGIPFDGLSQEQQNQLIDLIAVYTTRLRPGHSREWIENIREHTEQMHFGWVGGVQNGDVFYYRIHSPAILIEFEHVPGVIFNNEKSLALHIHTLVRTPNGNDYGRDLLRQHHLQHPH